MQNIYSAEWLCFASQALFCLEHHFHCRAGSLLASFQDSPSPIPLSVFRGDLLWGHESASAPDKGSRLSCPPSKHLTFSIHSLFFSSQPHARCHDELPGSLSPGFQTPQPGSLAPLSVYSRWAYSCPGHRKLEGPEQVVQLSRCTLGASATCH